MNLKEDPVHGAVAEGNIEALGAGPLTPRTAEALDEGGVTESEGEGEGDEEGDEFVAPLAGGGGDGDRGAKKKAAGATRRGSEMPKGGAGDAAMEQIFKMTKDEGAETSCRCKVRHILRHIYIETFSLAKHVHRIASAVKRENDSR